MREGSDLADLIDRPEARRKLDARAQYSKLVHMMEAMALHAAGSAERLTWDQICRRFPGEWVVLAETDWTTGWGPEFGTAVVVAHYKRRKEASPYIEAAFERYPQIGCFWTGALREPTPRFITP